MKKNEWLIAQSFERAHEIISAINTLSIRAKLALAGINDSPREEEVRRARQRLLTFLDRFETLIRDAEQHREGTVLGADPRFGQLAKKYLSIKDKRVSGRGLYGATFCQLRALLASERPEDQKELIGCLRDLRTLLEQHAHADITSILGDV